MENILPIWSKDGRLCACGLCPRASPGRARALRIPGLEGKGGVARKLEAEASRGALQRAIASCNGIPLVDERTGARHADGRLGGLWNRHGLKRINAACVRGGFIQN
jgi:hypothetical protein